MEAEYKIVDGKPDLVRDPSSGAIVNTNASAYRNAVEAANRRKAEAEKLDSAINDINNLKGEVSEIKDLLKELIKRV